MELVLAAYVIGFAVLTSIAANTKNRDPVGWFFIGLLFGVFGLAAALIVKGVEEDHSLGISASGSPQFDASLITKKCPDCAELIKLEARICRFCNRQFSETEITSQLAKAESHFLSMHRLPSDSKFNCCLDAEVQALKLKFQRHSLDKLQKMKKQGCDHWSPAALAAVDQLLSEGRRM